MFLIDRAMTSAIFAGSLALKRPTQGKGNKGKNEDKDDDTS